ncbi:MATE family efflux transporter [Alkalibaculum sp. M08DMB]|uniref:Probable multidrug resistance protein NorM n=1 Tax=Alkalibaculum sporogenes TaxID=2655001 RepID=A0A6A7K4D1_9FIRM|nr:MATE family efflux transporter [Alkalibaculum sporogenes]MPW24312.1 MATE family efflux transporter [Alkalibaculum sporogenes]
MNSVFNLFKVKDKKFYKAMLVIALPVMIQSFTTSLLNMIDTVMVGKLGETEIAAVGIANQYFFFYNMMLLGICGGCSVFISQYWGKRDAVNIKRVLGIGIISVVLLSMIFLLAGLVNPKGIIFIFNNDPMVIMGGASYLKIVIFSYLFTGITFLYSFSLRSIGKATQPLIINLIALIINVILNYILIFGKMGAPQMGVAGAALATLIARIIETIILLLSIYIKNGILAASIRELTDITSDYIKKAYRTILPVVLNDMCWGLASLVYIAVYGRMGTQAVAAIQICNTVNNLFMVVAFGLSSAASVMIGNSIGQENENQTKEYAKNFIGVSLLVSIFLGVILAVASPYILGFFNISDHVKNSAQSILYIISVVFFIRLLGIMLIVGILRGGGDAKAALIIEGFTMWFIGVPLIMIGAFVLKLPIYIVYSLAMVEELFKCIISLFRLKSGNWINDLT